MSAEPRSEAYARFVESVNGVDPAWRESVDMDALLGLEKDERRAAEELLLERVEIDDWRAPPALAALKARRAVMPLRRRLPETRGRMRLAVARALVDLGALPQDDEEIAAVLREGELDSGLAALVAAEEKKSAEIRDALAWACVHHPAPEVRANAGAQLFYMAGLAEDPLAWDYRPMYLALEAEDEAERRKAFEQICQIVGMPPELAG